MSPRSAHDFVKLALQLSIFASPKEPGLSDDELLEVGGRMGYKNGELRDALRGAVGPWYGGSPRLTPLGSQMPIDFPSREQPDYRDASAFQFVLNALDERGREVGVANASIDRSIVVARGIQSGITEHSMDVAVTYLLLSESLASDKGVLKIGARGNYARPEFQLEQARTHGSPVVSPDAERVKIFEAVKDVVSRRSDGRPPAGAALDAFPSALDKIGYGNFRLWWTQATAELRQLNPAATPVAAAVASAALVEGALTFAAKHARAHNLDAFKSPDYDGEPRTWKIEKLVKSATSGGHNAVLDAAAGHQADDLIKVRQRIHAGRMLSEYTTGVLPDLRPEEATAAKATAEKVVRCVLDWLARNPTSIS